MQNSGTRLYLNFCIFMVDRIGYFYGFWFSLSCVLVLLICLHLLIIKRNQDMIKSPPQTATNEQLQQFCTFLQSKYNDLLEKYSEAESTIDKLKVKRLSLDTISSPYRSSSSVENLLNHKDDKHHSSNEISQLRHENNQLRSQMAKYEASYSKLTKECEALNTKYSLSTVAIETLKHEKRTLARLLEKERDRINYSSKENYKRENSRDVSIVQSSILAKENSESLELLRSLSEMVQDATAEVKDSSILSNLAVLNQLQELVISYQESFCEETDERRLSEISLASYAMQYRRDLFQYSYNIVRECQEGGGDGGGSGTKEKISSVLNLMQQEAHRLNLCVQLEEELKSRFKENYQTLKRAHQVIPEPESTDLNTEEVQALLKEHPSSKTARDDAFEHFEMTADSLIESSALKGESLCVNVLKEMDFTHSMDEFQGIDEKFHAISRLAISDDKMVEQLHTAIKEYQQHCEHQTSDFNECRQKYNDLQEQFDKEIKAQQTLEKRLRLLTVPSNDTNNSANGEEEAERSTDNEISPHAMQEFLSSNIGKNTQVDKLIRNLSQLISLYSDRFNVLKKQLQQQTKISDKLDITSKAIGSLQLQSHHLMASLTAPETPRPPASSYISHSYHSQSPVRTSPSTTLRSFHQPHRSIYPSHGGYFTQPISSSALDTSRGGESSSLRSIPNERVRRGIF